MRIWDSETGKNIAILSGHENLVTSVSAYNTRVGPGSADKTIKVWDVVQKKSVSTMAGHSDSISSIAWSSKMKQLASSSFDKTLKIWNPSF